MLGDVFSSPAQQKKSWKGICCKRVITSVDWRPGMFARPCRLEVFAKQAGRKHGLQASINRLQTARGVLAWGHGGREEGGALLDS